MITVSAAIIIEDDKILVYKRPHGKERAGKYEFPGGKAERGETAEDALIRECIEELGVKIEIITFFEQVVHDYGDICVDLRFFICRIKGGELNANEGGEFAWFTVHDALKLDFCPPNRRVLELLNKKNNILQDYWTR